MTEKKRFKIATLGCRTNQYESQAYHSQLIQLGYEPAKDGESADVCIVNTCTVTESADAHSRHEIRQLARQNPGTKLVVTGCFAERQPDAIKQIEGVSLVVPNKEKEQLLSNVFPETEIPEFSIKHFDAHTRAFVKVQDGCNSYCTYCILPYVRGRSRSRPLLDILEEVKQLIANGYKEIVITGINVGDFDGNKGDDERPDSLADLVRAVDQIPGLERLRVSSIDPDEVDEDLADAILNGKTTCQSMHIVLQSGSNVILKRMNRKYTRQVFMETIERLQAANPDFTFTTDIIVGFPGETEVDFADTLDVMERVKFAKVHMFPYSERPRTRAAIMPGKVPAKEIKERKQVVLRKSEKMAFALREKYVGRKMVVLTEDFLEGRPGFMTGHTDNFLPAIIELPNGASNMLVEVEFYENVAEGLVGRVINKCCQGMSSCA